MVDYIIQQINEYKFAFVIFGVWLILWAISFILQKYKQSIRDKAAQEVLGNINFKEESSQILEIFQRYSLNRFEKYLEREDVCPDCGDLLLLRDGCYGKFIGCNNYPSCQYTRNY